MGRAFEPPLTVARITARLQNAYSDARRVWVDEQLSFNPCIAWPRIAPWQHMRARFKSYLVSSHFRRAAERRPMVEPRSIEELPD